MERIYDLRLKEVINIRDGARLGYICDVFVNMRDGRIVKIVVPGPSRFFGLFGSNMEYQIPWACIEKIGEDIILVNIDILDRDILIDV